LAHLVKVAADSTVILRNLEKAERLLDHAALLVLRIQEMDEQQRQKATFETETASALISQAVIHYTKVMHGEGTFNKMPKGALPSSLQPVHAELLVLRNQVIAHHVHKTKHVQGPWDRQDAVFIPNHSTHAIRFPYEAANWREETVKSLALLLEGAMEAAIKHHDAAVVALVEQLDKFATLHANAPQLMLECAFDLSLHQPETISALLSEGRAHPLNFYDPLAKQGIKEGQAEDGD
jgi:hypothetical protein